ncbi:MAG: hypothetical protein ACLFO2_02170 [Candidatus Woesearchaeota archaeon]
MADIKMSDAQAFKETLQAADFNDVARAMAEHTAKTGYETLTGLFRNMENGRIIYAPTMVVGDETSVSGQVAANRLYDKHYGTGMPLDKYIRLFGEETEKPLPVSHGNSWESVRRAGERFTDYIPFANIHTHPPCSLYRFATAGPSKGDVDKLASLVHKSLSIRPDQEGRKTFSMILASYPLTAEGIDAAIITADNEKLKETSRIPDDFKDLNESFRDHCQQLQGGIIRYFNRSGKPSLGFDEFYTLISSDNEMKADKERFEKAGLQYELGTLKPGEGLVR